MKFFSILLKIYVERYLQHYHGETERHINMSSGEHLGLTSFSGKNIMKIKSRRKIK